MYDALLLWYKGESLHSNLVLFKSDTGSNISNGNIRFTFQSGSIQIKTQDGKEHTIDKLYIPIWFYSNKEVDMADAILMSFTFQSGSIQIQLSHSKIRA